MNAYKKLLIEYQGIYDTLKDYSSGSTAIHIMPELKDSLDKKDKDAILYCMDVIIEWYEENIHEIHNNNWVVYQDEHDRIFRILKELRKEIEEFVFEENEVEKEIEIGSPIIFLSHRSSDKAYGDALEHFITGLGVRNEQLIYTSHPLHKIPLDANIYDFLRQHINSKIFMIILWSDHYLESPACLNEMGAAWVVQCDYTNIYVPDFSFGNPKYHECAVDTHKMGAVLNGDEHCKQNMLQLKNKIQEIFGIQNEENKIVYLLDTFIKEIHNIST